MTTQQFVLSFIVLNAVIAIAHYRAEPLRTSILRLAIQIDSIGKAAFVEPAIRAIHLLAGRGGIFMRSRYHALYPFLWCATSALPTLSVSHYFFDSEPLKSEVATARTNLLSQTIYRLSKDEYEIYARMSIQEFENVYRYYMMLCVQAKVHFSNAAYFVGMSMYALYLVWILRGATSSRLVRSERDVFGSLLMLLVGALLIFLGAFAISWHGFSSGVLGPGFVRAAFLGLRSVGFHLEPLPPGAYLENFPHTHIMISNSSTSWPTFMRSALTT